MGFRFRKSIKIGNARINMSKSGVGFSFGSKGARVTKMANGRTRTTLSVPGTGMSYVTESSSNKIKSGGKQQMNNKSAGKYEKSPEQKPRNKWNGVWRWLFIVFLAFCIIASFPSFGSVLFLVALILMLPVNAIQSAIGKYTKPKLKTIMIALITFLAFFFTPEPAAATPVETIPKFETVASETIVLTETGSTIPETKPAEITTAIETTEEPTTEGTTTVTETVKETVAETTEPKPVERDYVLNTSSMKIHKPGCKSVKDIKDSNRLDFHGTFEELIARGYTACGNCHPF